MKLTNSRVLLALVSCQILAFMPMASAQGPYEELIAEIRRLRLQGEIGTKVDAWLERLQSFATEQGEQPLSVVMSQYKGTGDPTQAARQIVRYLYSERNLTPAGQQLGILWYVLHLVNFQGRVHNTERFENLLEACPAARMLQQMLIFFDSLYELQPETLKLFKKGSGDQLGITAQFALVNGKMYKYRIKTHSSGRSSNDPASGPGDVDPHELFVYSVLEAAGLGPEVHFFRYDTKDFYIATRDVGDNGTPEPFLVSTYDQLEDDPGIKRTVFDWMTKLENHETTWEALGGEIPVVVKALVQSNVLAHILNLTDLNGGNTCFIHAVDRRAITNYRIVDFRPNGIDWDKKSFEAFLGRLPADGGSQYQFREGNGDSMTNRVLGTRNENWFLILARYWFPKRIFSAIDKAEERIAPIIQELYPPTSPGSESEQFQLFRARVQWFRWNAKTFFEQLNACLMGSSELSSLFFMALLPRNNKWEQATDNVLKTMVERRATEPSGSRTPPRSPAIRPSGFQGGASIVASPSKSPGSPIAAPVARATMKAEKEIREIFSLMRKNKGILQEAVEKEARRVMREAGQIIDRIRNEARGVTNTRVIQDLAWQINDATAEVSIQKAILEAAIPKIKPSGKAAAATKKTGGSRKPPAETGTASKPQEETEDGEGQKEAPKPGTPVDFETPKKKKQSGRPEEPLPPKESRGKK